ncbi:hypothetical protein C8F01DRAFT_1100571 [Mycena amicta]|nr:hypothetical protein C8F01DRAFT_1100571 [Mycena amicta]
MPSLMISGAQPSVALPALYLYPLNDSFVPKHISLIPSGQRIKIGRQTNAKTNPTALNAYFDSKVLSRQHAEVWEENDKIFIKDVKSSNGTFINGERLSQEGLESEPFELHSDDIVEFGIDIVGEDNKTIIHHKVAARVACIFNEQQAAIAARAEQQQQQNQGYSQSPILPQGGPGSGFNFAPGGPQGRRPPMQQQQPPHQALGSMGGSIRPPGKGGLTFDHILTRLQGELNKSRETGQDLQTLSSAMNDIQDTLGGSLPSNLPQYPHALPPVRPPSAQPVATDAPPPPPDNGPALADLQSQWLSTQSSLAAHVDKVRALEGVFADQEALKEEVRTLRELVGGLQQDSAEDTELFDDDDDARSVATVIPHTLERVEEEDEDDLEEYEKKDLEQDEDRVQRHAELGRPRTPEPTNMGMPRRSTSQRSPLMSSEPPSPSIDELTARLTQLSSQLESALAMSSTLQAQQAAAQSTIVSLEDKVKRLEGLVTTIVAAKDAPNTKGPAAESVTATLLSFKSSLQGQWATVQEEWATERERLKRTRDEWEREIRGAVNERVTAKLAPSSGVYFNGGLVTPPSPRSLSADSGSSGSVGGRRRRRRSTSRGRSSSLRRNSTGSSNADAPDSPVSDEVLNGKRRETAAPVKRPLLETGEEDSIRQRAMNVGNIGKANPDVQRTMHIQTAIGVLVLSVAAAAVIWRVKPE